MSKDNLEETCILDGIGDFNVPLDSSPCINCPDCYLPKNMDPGKKELYRKACESVNNYGSNYNSG